MQLMRFYQFLFKLFFQHQVYNNFGAFRRIRFILHPFRLKICKRRISLKGNQVQTLNYPRSCYPVANWRTFESLHPLSRHKRDGKEVQKTGKSEDLPDQI